MTTERMTGGLIRFTAITVALAGAACNDGSLVALPNDAPVARLASEATEYSPLDTARFDASHSYDPDGDNLQYQWTMLERPSGSNASIIPLEMDRSQVEFFVDFAGDYKIQVKVTDAQGLSDTEKMTFSATPWQGIHVELSWDTSESDVDLHFLNATEDGDFYVAPWDCHYANPAPEWGDATDNEDDPRLDRDDTNGFGPENINIPEPKAADYEINVHYYSDDSQGPTTARVRLFLSGELIFEDSALLTSTGKVWRVGKLSWPTGEVEPDGTIFNNPFSYFGAPPAK
jgi:hypothetical protein